jgi:hypothetical protein
LRFSRIGQAFAAIGKLLACSEQAARRIKGSLRPVHKDCREATEGGGLIGVRRIAPTKPGSSYTKRNRYDSKTPGYGERHYVKYLTTQGFR